MDFKPFYFPFAILMALSALFWPFWITAALFLIGVLIFPNFYAGVIILFVMDALYSFETFKIGPVYGILSISGIILYILVSFIKEETRIFKR